MLNQWFQIHIYIVTGLLRARDKHRHHNEFPLHTQPGRKVVYTECHRPGAMATALLTERIHAIRTYAEPYIPRIICKCWECSVYFSPLRPISGVSQHIVLLTFFFVPSHQFSIRFVHEQTFLTWY